MAQQKKTFDRENSEQKYSRTSYDRSSGRGGERAGYAGPGTGKTTDRRENRRYNNGILGIIGTIIILVLYIWLQATDSGSEITAEHRIKTELVRVVDGDIIIVNYENEKTRVRLIGINSPESVHEDESKNTQEGRDASAFLKEYLADVKTVWLEFDTEQQDQYERTLAYVWMNADGTDVGEDMLNGIIVKNGYADARSYEPNVKYQDELEEVEQSR